MPVDSKQIASPFKISSLVSRAGTPTVTAYADNVTTTLQFGGGTANTSTQVRAAAAGTINIGENTVVQTTNLGSTNGASATTVRSGTGGLNVTATGATLALAATGANEVRVSTNSVERMRISAVKTVSIGDGTIGVYGPSANVPFQVYSDNNVAQDGNFFMQFNATAGFGPYITLLHGRGSAATPTATQNGDTLGGLFFDGVGSSTVASVGALIQSVATATHTATAWGAELQFATSANGASAVSYHWKIANDGHFLAVTDNTLDIGATGATRPRRVYVGTEVVVGNTITISGSVISASAAMSLNSVGLTLQSTGANTIQFDTNGTSRWNVASTGHFLANVDNTLDIGATGATRPRTAHLGTSAVIAGTLTLANGGITATNPLAITGTQLDLAASGALPVQIATNGSTRWLVSSAGHFLAAADNVYDIGSTGAGARPRTIYARTSFVAEGGTNSLTAADGAITQSAGSLTITATAAVLSLDGTGIETSATTITADAGLAIATTTTGVLSLDSGTTGAINVGTGANAKTVTIGNVTGATAVVINTGSGNLDVNTPTITTSATALTADAALTVTATAAALILAATGANTVAIHTNGSARLTMADVTATLADAVDLVVGTTTGTKIGTSTAQKLGFWNSSPVVQQASAALTNNVTSGGTTDVIADFTDLAVYANDASTIRDDIYQIARKLKEVGDALRLYGILG